MRVKVVPVEDKEFRGFKAVVFTVLNSGIIMPSGFIIEISREDMFGSKSDGFKVCGLDSLILDKINSSGRYNKEALEQIEVVTGDIELVKKK